MDPSAFDSKIQAVGSCDFKEDDLDQDLWLWAIEVGHNVRNVLAGLIVGDDYEAASLGIDGDDGVADGSSAGIGARAGGVAVAVLAAAAAAAWELSAEAAGAGLSLQQT